MLECTAKVKLTPDPRSRFWNKSRGRLIEKIRHFNWTQSNSIHELSSIEFGNRIKSNSHKNNWTTELDQTFGFWTLVFNFCRTSVENQEQVFWGFWHVFFAFSRPHWTSLFIFFSLTHWTTGCNPLNFVWLILAAEPNQLTIKWI